MTLERALLALTRITPERRLRARYQQRDALQQEFIPRLEVGDRDRFERAMNDHLRL